MKKSTFIMLIFLFSSCVINKPAENEYTPFECIERPEQRLYFPEEELIFLFNMDINPLSAQYFKAESVETEESLPFKIEGDAIKVISPLPQLSTISIEISSGLKSVDNLPLMTGETFTENKEPLTLLYETGEKVPEVETIYPDDSKSAAIAVKFDGLVDIKFKNISPVPDDLMKVENWLVFIYESPVSKIEIKNAVAVSRDSVIENILIELPQKQPAETEETIKYTVFDNAVTVDIADDSAVAAKINGETVMCIQKCAFTITGLSAETLYEINSEIFTSSGKKSHLEKLVTNELKPHIIISEVMHTPEAEPEKNWEFVEIYNYGEMDFDLADCFIDDKNDGKGIDPLILKDPAASLILKPGETAVITGNEAAFGDLDSAFLWLNVDDTTIADGGLTSTESVEIICRIDEVMILQDQVLTSSLKTDRGFSFNKDISGNVCQSKESGGSPGKYYECE